MPSTPPKAKSTITPGPRGKKPSAGKKVLVDACISKDICSTGSIKQLLERLQRHEIKKLGEAGVQKKKMNVSKKLKKDTSSPNSSPQKPLHLSAKQYVEKICKGNLSDARPEWVIVPKPGKKSENDMCKWMIADIRGSKVGPIIRWVRA